MMKSLLRPMTSLFFMAFSIQLAAQDDCEKDISTNPIAPFNAHSFPDIEDPNSPDPNNPNYLPTYNPWINSDFDIGELVGGSVPAPLGLLASLRENAPSSLSCNPEALNEIDHLNS